MTLNVECLLVPDGLVWVFQKLLIYWDFHTQPSLGFTENGPKNRKYPVSGSCVDINALLMSEVREEWASSDGYFQQDNTHCNKAQIISDWFLEHDNEFTLLKWPPQSPDLNPIEHLWDVVEREIRIMNVQPTNLQQLCDAIMSIWTKSLRNFSNTLLNLCHEELREFWRQKGVQTGISILARCT